MHTSKSTKLNNNNEKDQKYPINSELLIVRNTFLSHGLAGVKAQIMGLNKSNSGAVNRKKAGIREVISMSYFWVIVGLVAVMESGFGPQANS